MGMKVEHRNSSQSNQGSRPDGPPCIVMLRKCLMCISNLQDKMEEMQQHNMSWIEVQFLRKAVDILCECRRTLMYTYVFAYYLSKNNQSEIFEASANRRCDLNHGFSSHLLTSHCRRIRRTSSSPLKSCRSTSSGRSRRRI